MANDNSRKHTYAKVRKRTWTSGGQTRTAWLADYFDSQGKRREKGGFRTQKEAKDWLAETVIGVKRGTHTPDSKSITVAKAAEQWLARPISLRTGEKLETATLAQYENHVAKYINPLLGQRKLSQLTTPQVGEFLDQMIAGGTSVVMVRKILASLKAIISEAQRCGRVNQNVALPCTVGASGRRDKRQIEDGVDYPTPDEMHRIFAEASRYRALLIVATCTGMRGSELRGVRWRDVNFVEGVIHIRQRADEKNKMGSPKSKASRRDIPMPAGGIVANTLRLWQNECPKSDLDLVFPTRKGTVQNHSNIAERGLKATQIRAGVVTADGKAKYSMHKLRHFFATAQSEGGASLKDVQVWMGHSSFQMTSDVYGHKFTDKEGDAAKLLAAEAKVLKLAAKTA